MLSPVDRYLINQVHHRLRVYGIPKYMADTGVPAHRSR